MLGNYLTTALRLLWRERGYAAINIFGLAVGFCLCLLTVQLAAYQLSVGDFHEKKRPGIPRVEIKHAEYRVHGRSTNTAGTGPQGAIARSRGGGTL